ncbi:helix-turn-helix domain-containing protein [Nonomuraea fuscirosea]|uniref:helix-turn-helix domain-containing protein n=1 Tax=Nonomuraea fuscirosea TaxID=1291556 RepID=UPI002DDA87B4|nr:helix-turn-helix transcriptional regulator [Nonomuraea fuscirosea]WSA50503.1 helix-turn-helix domain-containing protein [Nonomuraea fuscirosea]
MNNDEQSTNRGGRRDLGEPRPDDLWARNRRRTIVQAHTPSESGTMGRKQQPLTGATEIERFAMRLRGLRAQRGMTIRQLAGRAGYAHSTLSKAEAGRELPSWEVVESFVQACDDDPAAWRSAWAAASVPPDEQPEPAPDDPPARRALLARLTPRARWALALLTAVMLLSVAGTVAWSVSTTRGVPPSANRPQTNKPQSVAASTASQPVATPTKWRALSETHPVPGVPADAMDPIRSGCGSPDVVDRVITLDDVAVRLSDGAEFGRLRLRHQPACTASWALVLGPHSPQRAVHIVAYRPSDAVSAPSVYRGKYSSSYGNMLMTTHGCVYVEAFVETPQGRGPTARTRCA